MTLQEYREDAAAIAFYADWARRIADVPRVKVRRSGITTEHRNGTGTVRYYVARPPALGGPGATMGA